MEDRLKQVVGPFPVVVLILLARTDGCPVAHSVRCQRAVKGLQPRVYGFFPLLTLLARAAGRIVAYQVWRLGVVKHRLPRVGGFFPMLLLLACAGGRRVAYHVWRWRAVGRRDLLQVLILPARGGLRTVAYYV